MRDEGDGRKFRDEVHQELAMLKKNIVDTILVVVHLETKVVDIVDTKVVDLERKIVDKVDVMWKKIEDLELKCSTFEKSGMVRMVKGCQSATKIQLPTYDCITSWETYKKQFDAATNVNH